MRVYLVQHGEAKSKDEDPDRHLTDPGAADVKKMAECVRPLGLDVNAVWHSGKPRARQTAELLAPAIGAEGHVEEHDDLSPNAPVVPVGDRLWRRADDVMIVGHLPFLNRLASSLIVGDEEADAVAFQNGGVVCIERDDEGVWRLRWMLTPDMVA